MVRPIVDGRYELAFGHRRVAACRLLWERGAGEWSIEVEVDEISDEKMAVIALAENVRRRDLTDIEVVRAHKWAIDETDLTVQALADELGINRPTLSNNLRILDLPDFVLEHVESGDLGLSVAREFLVLQNADHAHLEDMRHVVNAIVDSYRFRHEGAPPNWSHRNVRNEISERVAVYTLAYIGQRTGKTLWRRSPPAGVRAIAS